MAAKKNYSERLAVASAYDLPFLPKSFDAALSVFSPFDTGEVARILESQGTFLVVGPGPTHLHGLANHIYKHPRPHKGNFNEMDKSTDFKCTDEKAIDIQLQLHGEDIYNLFTMTPYFWSASKNQQQAISALGVLNTPASFIIRVYEKV